jgi:hypothetical protein
MTDWETHKVDSFEGFEKEIRDLTPGDLTLREEYWYRGQSDATWGLQPSFMRSCCKLGLSNVDLADLEYVALNAFKWTAHLHVKPDILEKVRTIPCWWSLMQHHGAPTRLLDWSLSPYVAAYFAVLQEGSGAPGAVWAFCCYQLRQAYETRDPGEPIRSFEDDDAADWYETRIRLLKGRDIVLPLSFSLASSERIVAQQGRFTMSFNNNASHDCMISQIGKTYLRKIEIPHEKKPEFLLRLRTMNITGASLFPGVDGLGMSMKELLSLVRFYRRAVCPVVGMSGISPPPER